MTDTPNDLDASQEGTIPDNPDLQVASYTYQ